MTPDELRAALVTALTYYEGPDAAEAMADDLAGVARSYAVAHLHAAAEWDCVDGYCASQVTAHATALDAGRWEAP